MINVLYVEDDAFSRDVLRMVARIDPDMFHAEVFENSENFETRLITHKPQPDLILLDIHMKPITGFEMLKIIRKHTKFDHIPVVALTASVMNEEIDDLKTSGFQGVIAKPINLEAFPDILYRIMAGEAVWNIR